MAVGLSVELFVVRPYGPGRGYMPPQHKRAFELSSRHPTGGPDIGVTVPHI